MVDRVNVSMNARDETPEAAKAREDHEKEMLKVAENGTTNIKDRDERNGINTDTDRNSDDNDSSDDENTNARPDNIPEKFWDAEKGEVNVEALLKSQQDAERALREKQGKKPDETDDDDDDDEDKGGDKDKPTAEQSDSVAKATAEFAEKGELSAETYDDLAKVGLSKEMVNQYIEGQQAIVTSLQNAAFGEFDGEKENYDKAVEWAVENLSKDEIEALDVQITSTNPAIVAQGAKALAAKYNENADLDPTNTVHGKGNESNSSSHFKSGAEMQDAMSDPRYKRDQAFRDEVARKIDRAEKAGVNLFG